MNNQIIALTETDSTNSYATAHAAELAPWTIVTARSQTSGRGQRGNSWESEDGKNLTLSMVVKPDSFPARDQFAISEAVALAVVDTLACQGIDSRIKWPNDIYVGDSKICGILIEHIVTGMDITNSVAGLGLNVNQIEFRSDAPNPVSMAQLTGREFDLDDLLEDLGEKLREYCERAFTPEGRVLLHGIFKRSLWRGDGSFHTFALPDGELFEARISDVEEGGMLVLETRGGECLRFAFKEVVFILTPEAHDAVKSEEENALNAFTKTN